MPNVPIGISVGDVAASFVATPEGYEALDIPLAANQTDIEVAFVFDTTRGQYLIIVCDQDVLVETNVNTGTDDITVTPTSPFFWVNGDPRLTTDITKLFLTNTTACTVKIRALTDATP